MRHFKRTTIKSVTCDLTTGCKFNFAESYYAFEIVVTSSDLSEMTAVMWNPSGHSSSPFILFSQYNDPKPVLSASVYTGKLHKFLDEAENEHVVLVLPFGIATEAPVGLYFQWSADTWHHKKKESQIVNATFRNVMTTPNQVNGTFDDGEYTFNVTMQWKDGRQVGLPAVHMSDWAGNTTSFVLQYKESSFRTSKEMTTKKVTVLLAIFT